MPSCTPSVTDNESQKWPFDCSWHVKMSWMSWRHPGQFLWWVSSASCPFLGSLTPVSEQPPCIYSCIIPRDSLQCHWWEASALVAELQQCTSNTLITSIPSQPIKIIRIFSHQNYSMPGDVQWCVGKNKDPVFFAGCFTANEWPMQLLVYCGYPCLSFCLLAQLTVIIFLSLVSKLYAKKFKLNIISFPTEQGVIQTDR